MNRRLRNRKARRERKRLAAQYDSMSASLAEVTRKNEERFEEAIRRRTDSVRVIAKGAGVNEQRLLRCLFTHPWLYSAIALACGANFFVGLIMNATSDGDPDLWPLAWFIGMFVSQGMAEVANDAREAREAAKAWRRAG